MEEYVVYSDEKLPVECYKKFQEIRQANRFCDVTLKAENVDFPAHRIILSAAIPYFHAMFMNDKVNYRQNAVTIMGIDPETVDALLEFAYTGCIRITKDNACRVLSGSTYLQLFNVRDACCEFLEKRFQPDNVVGIQALANQLHCANLEKAANQFINKHFVEITQSEEYISLKPAALRDIISREEIRENTSEEQVFNAVLNWVKKDEDNRKNILPQLLSNIRMHLLNPEFLVEQVGKEPLIHASTECRNLLEEAKDCHLMHLSSSSKTKIELQNDYFDCIIALKGDELEWYDIKNDSWMDDVPPCRKSYGPALTVLQNKIYVVGGYKDSTLSVFNPRTRSWSVAAPIPHEIGWGCAATLKNKVYMCGGIIGEIFEATDTVQCYDPESDKWHAINQMNEVRSCSCAVVLDDCLYVLGGGMRGGFDYDPCASVEKYDPQCGKWSLSTPMLTKRCQFGATAMNGRIYVAGGSTGSTISRSVEEYNPATKEWKHIQSMNVARQDFSLVSAYGKLYAVGGYNKESDDLNSVEVYDPDNGKWSFVAHMKKIKGYVRAAPFYR